MSLAVCSKPETKALLQEFTREQSAESMRIDKLQQLGVPKTKARAEQSIFDDLFDDMFGTNKSASAASQLPLLSAARRFPARADGHV